MLTVMVRAGAVLVDHCHGLRQASLDEQLAGLRAVLTRNSTLVEVLTRAAVLALPDWYLVAGCPYQTVWNVVTG